MLGWPDGEWIGNMLMMGHRDARCSFYYSCSSYFYSYFRFLTEFLETYKLFRPDIWYYNGGEKPVREVR